MNKCVKIVILLSFVLLCIIGCTAQPQKYSDPGQEIEIVSGEEFIIGLESNPTTGFEWLTEFDESFLEPVKSEYETDKALSGMTGVGGEQQFTFKGLKPGKTKITLKYKREWEQAAADTKIFTVSIKEQ